MPRQRPSSGIATITPATTPPPSSSLGPSHHMWSGSTLVLLSDTCRPPPPPELEMDPKALLWPPRRPCAAVVHVPVGVCRPL